MPTTLIEIDQSIHDKLLRLAEEDNEPLESILAKAIEDYRRKIFLIKANESFAALRENEELWQQELEERKEWDATLEDDWKQE